MGKDEGMDTRPTPTPSYLTILSHTRRALFKHTHVDFEVLSEAAAAEMCDTMCEALIHVEDTATDSLSVISL